VSPQRNVPVGGTRLPMADLHIDVVRIKNWGGQKWTSEVNDQQNISGFIYMVLKSRDYVFKMSIIETVYSAQYSSY